MQQNFNLRLELISAYAARCRYFYFIPLTIRMMTVPETLARPDRQRMRGQQQVIVFMKQGLSYHQYLSTALVPSCCASMDMQSLLSTTTEIRLVHGHSTLHHFPESHRRILPALELRPDDDCDFPILVLHRPLIQHSMTNLRNATPEIG